MARVKELQTAIAEKVISAEIRRRSWRVQVLEDRVNGMLALSASRAKLYAEKMEASHSFQVHDNTEEQIAIEDGCIEVVNLDPAEPLPGADCKEAPPAPRPKYPKTMRHPGYPNGGGTGLLVKDYRGKENNQVVWKFDSALESGIMEALKQAANRSVDC